MVLASSDTVTLALPAWILWGVVVALGLTFGLLLFVSLVAMAITSITGRWLGGAQPWREDIGATFKTFLIIGLPVGLLSSYIWSFVGPWQGVLTGILLIALLWLGQVGYNRLTKQRR